VIMSPESPLLNLPPEVICRVFEFADDFSVLAALAQTTRIFYQPDQRSSPTQQPRGTTNRRLLAGSVLQALQARSVGRQSSGAIGDRTSPAVRPPLFPPSAPNLTRSHLPTRLLVNTTAFTSISASSSSSSSYSSLSLSLPACDQQLPWQPPRWPTRRSRHPRPIHAIAASAIPSLFHDAPASIDDSEFKSWSLSLLRPRPSILLTLASTSPRSACITFHSFSNVCLDLRRRLAHSTSSFGSDSSLRFTVTARPSKLSVLAISVLGSRTPNTRLARPEDLAYYLPSPADDSAPPLAQALTIRDDGRQKRILEASSAHSCPHLFINGRASMRWVINHQRAVPAPQAHETMLRQRPWIAQAPC
jgi:hypothetical protein